MGLMLRRLRLFLGLVSFSHTIFALPFALSSAALAWYDAWENDPDSPLFTEHGISWKGTIVSLTGILLCMVFARSTAMAFNRLVDRKIDALNPRTASRHLPAGLLTPAAVAVFTLACAMGFLASTFLFLAVGNPWPTVLAIPVLLFVCAYSYTKRFTFLAHLWLGASLLLAPLAAWIAIRGLEGLLGTPLVLGLVVLFWVTGFDILYACQDVEFDHRAGLASVPARFGVGASLRIALACHVVMVLCLLLLLWITPPLQGPIFAWAWPESRC